MTSMIDQAKELVDGQRQEDYGDVNESFQRIAGLWLAYLGKHVDKYDVAKMMVLLKISRAKHNNHVDSYVDAIGYINCVDKLIAMDEGCRDIFKVTQEEY